MKSTRNLESILKRTEFSSMQNIKKENSIFNSKKSSFGSEEILESTINSKKPKSSFKLAKFKRNKAKQFFNQNLY